MTERIAVIGAGNGGCTVAADLTLNGYEVNLFEIPEFAEPFDSILKGREITISGKAGNGTARLNKATMDIREAIDGVETIFIVVPAFGHEYIAELITPHLKENQLIALVPGAFGTIAFLTEMRKQNVSVEVSFAEAATLPYATTLVSAHEVHVHILGRVLPVGVFPARRTDEIIKKMKQYYPVTTASRDILDAALNNLNPVIHPAPCILSMSSIEKGDFYLYRDGYTESVIRVCILMDQERIAVRKACSIHTEHYGFNPEAFDIMEAYYGEDIIEKSVNVKGPGSRMDRKITEDVPFGLVFYSTVGKKAGVKTPVCDALINMSSTINGENYWETGTNIEKMFIGDLSMDRLNAFLYDGQFMEPGTIT